MKKIKITIEEEKEIFRIDVPIGFELRINEKRYLIRTRPENNFSQWINDDAIYNYLKKILIFQNNFAQTSLGTIIIPENVSLSKETNPEYTTFIFKKKEIVEIETNNSKDAHEFIGIYAKVVAD